MGKFPELGVENGLYRLHSRCALQHCAVEVDDFHTVPGEEGLDPALSLGRRTKLRSDLRARKKSAVP